uniref:Uncharacterized protein n=1 Tax=Arundo donax TaxID=35708 RepID=A0A0A9EQE7_ARUDO
MMYGTIILSGSVNQKLIVNGKKFAPISRPSLISSNEHFYYKHQLYCQQ